MRVALLAILIVATAAACGAYRFPAASPAGAGTVSGQVTVVPCAPIDRPNAVPCTNRVMPGVEIDFTGNGTTIAAHTDARGGYSVQLAAGTWKVGFKNYLRIIKGPATVMVQPGSTVVADYVVDSGIRTGVN